MRVAVVHDWLVAKGGAESVLEQILECYPGAQIFTLLDFMAPGDRSFLEGRTIHTSFMQKLPFVRRRYRLYLPLMPVAAESFDLSDFDLVISSSFCVAKGVLTGPDQLHVSYMHSPMRYAWELQHQYLREAKQERGLKGALTRAVLHRMRLWDCRTANGVDSFVCNSSFIARRVWKTYRRESTVIYPPVDTDYFFPEGRKEDFYVTASRLVPYKRVNLIVEAFRRLPGRRLVVVGEGPDYERLKARAPRNVHFVGHQPRSALRDYIRRAKAFLFAALEDFGIAPVEAQACGTPVIAFGRGGAAESVVDGRTGILFKDQTVEGIVGAVRRFEANAVGFDPAVMRGNAERFNTERFKSRFKAHVEAKQQERLRRAQVALQAAAWPPESSFTEASVRTQSRAVG